MVSRKIANTPSPPRYLPASARMIAERAEQGTKVISSEAITRSRPVVVLPMAEIAGTLHPSPSRNGTATPPCRPMR